MTRRPLEPTTESAHAKPFASRLRLAVTPPGRPAFEVPLPESGTLRVGRDADADIVVDSGSLSRVHFALELRGGAALVRDVGSRNGTLVDGVPIGDAGVALPFGSEILAGEVRFSIVRRTVVDEAGAEEDGVGPSRAVDDAAIPPAFRYPSLRAVHADLRRIAPRHISVLLRGETGTGKEVVAREIHRLSGRRGPLVAVNAAALPESLVESELFGHERGAFSGAVAAKQGLIESSDGGTLFLDEIGELPVAMQAKLLRVLEERSVRRVGATTERKIDLRVVTATHQDLAALAREKRFRSDLLFRLDGATIELPPLRERRGEIVDLARGLLVDLVGEDAPRLDDIAGILATYEWPGNVRELRQVLERAVAFSDGGALQVVHLPRAIVEAAANAPMNAPPSVNPGVTPDAAMAEAGSATDVRSATRDFERERILAALEQTGGNRTRAAELLGLPRRTLVYKLSRMRIDES